MSTEQIIDCWQNGIEPYTMKTKQTRTVKQYLINSVGVDPIAEREASTTVWTNHGEPQPLDDKHFGVALEAEVETEATRQAKHSPLPLTAHKAYYVGCEDDEQYITAKLPEYGECNIAKVFSKADAAYIVKACNEYEKVVAQRDELLAAMKGLFENCAMVHSQWGENSNHIGADAAIENAKTSITNASE